MASFKNLKPLFNNSLLEIVKDQNYNFQDEITVSPKHLPEYEKKVKMFLEEHIHDDPEARGCLEGSGYFDVRDKNDKWIRILVEKGDLLIIPAGIYHRNGNKNKMLKTPFIIIVISKQIRSRLE